MSKATPARPSRPIAAPTPPREVAIANRHPRLRLDRRAVTQVITTLDAHFRFLPGDRPHLTPAARRHLSFTARRSSFPPAAPAGELSLVFLTDAALAQLHDDFLDDPTTTDVITFEGEPTLGTAGEICVSADAALRHLAGAPSLNSQLSTLNSAAAAAAFSLELTLYVVHGWLHLAGYDDLRPAKKRRMRAAEARALKLLQAHGVAPAFRLK